mmetsp:Transcript_13132/g.19702  ORF Transcript_13132/g.19702 Transcript_13132/m.19702 type:complete len:80 (+) Transcript_13132:178-417(+)
MKQRLRKARRPHLQQRSSDDLMFWEISKTRHLDPTLGTLDGGEIVRVGRDKTKTLREGAESKKDRKIGLAIFNGLWPIL